MLSRFVSDFGYTSWQTGKCPEWEAKPPIPGAHGRTLRYYSAYFAFNAPAEAARLGVAACLDEVIDAVTGSSSGGSSGAGVPVSSEVAGPDSILEGIGAGVMINATSEMAFATSPRSLTLRFHLASSARRRPVGWLPAENEFPQLFAVLAWR